MLYKYRTKERRISSILIEAKKIHSRAECEECISVERQASTVYTVTVKERLISVKQSKYLYVEQRKRD